MVNYPFNRPDFAFLSKLLFPFSKGPRSSSALLKPAWWRITTIAPLQSNCWNILSLETNLTRDMFASSSKTISTALVRREEREVRHFNTVILNRISFLNNKTVYSAVKEFALSDFVWIFTRPLYHLKCNCFKIKKSVLWAEITDRHWRFINVSVSLIRCFVLCHCLFRTQCR